MLRKYDILLFSLFYSCSSIQYFEFENLSQNDQISTTTLANPVHLPKVFTICSFHNQPHIQEQTFYVLYENVELTKPWFSLSLWNLKGELWADIKGDWYLLGALPLINLGQWINICSEINLKANTIRTSINGGRVISVNITNFLQIPTLFMRYIFKQLHMLLSFSSLL